MMQTTNIHTPSLKEKQRKEREELILQAAEEVFQEKGYYEASMDEIAARVGIAKGTIYTHFPGKEELVVAIFNRNMRAFLEGVEAISATEQTPRAKLEAILEFIYTRLYTRQTHLLSILYNGVDLKRMIVEKSEYVRQHWGSLVAHIGQLLEEGKAMGEFDSSIPTKVMLFSFLSLFSPKTYDHLLLGDDFTPEELIAHLRRVYFNGITKHDEK